MNEVLWEYLHHFVLVYINNILVFFWTMVEHRQHISRTLEATKALQAFKKAFSCAPLLVHPDLNKPFVVKVDASISGVGAVLSQQQGQPLRLHPCAFFSRKLTPMEQNYNIGNQELLTIKLALEESKALAGVGLISLHCAH